MKSIFVQNTAEQLLLTEDEVAAVVDRVIDTIREAFNDPELTKAIYTPALVIENIENLL